MKQLSQYINEKILINKNSKFIQGVSQASIDYWEDELGFNPLTINYDGYPKAKNLLKRAERNGQLESLIDYLVSGIYKHPTKYKWKQDFENMDEKDYEQYNEPIGESLISEKILINKDSKFNKNNIEHLMGIFKKITKTTDLDVLHIIKSFFEKNNVTSIYCYSRDYSKKPYNFKDDLDNYEYFEMNTKEYDKLDRQMFNKSSNGPKKTLQYCTEAKLWISERGLIYYGNFAEKWSVIFKCENDNNIWKLYF